MARADGSLRNLLARLGRVDLLVVDDWAMAPMQETERRDFWEICEERYQLHSTVLTSQVPVAKWHEQIGDPTIADGILDRLVHNAHRMELRGESMRKTKTKRTESKEESKPDPPRCWCRQALAASQGAGWGKGLQTLAPSPHTPIPAQKQSSLTPFGTPLRLTISITYPDNRSRRRRCAPILIEIAGNSDRLHSGTLIEITGIRSLTTNLPSDHKSPKSTVSALVSNYNFW